MNVDLREACGREMHPIFADGSFSQLTIREQAAARLCRIAFALTCALGIPAAPGRQQTDGAVFGKGSAR